MGLRLDQYAACSTCRTSSTCGYMGPVWFKLHMVCGAGLEHILHLCAGSSVWHWCMGPIQPMNWPCTTHLAWRAWRIWPPCPAQRFNQVIFFFCIKKNFVHSEFSLFQQNTNIRHQENHKLRHCITTWHHYPSISLLWPSTTLTSLPVCSVSSQQYWLNWTIGLKIAQHNLNSHLLLHYLIIVLRLEV